MIELADAERGLRVLRRDLKEVQEAIRAAEALLAEAERRGRRRIFKR